MAGRLRPELADVAPGAQAVVGHAEGDAELRTRRCSRSNWMGCGHPGGSSRSFNPPRDAEVRVSLLDDLVILRAQSATYVK